MVILKKIKRISFINAVYSNIKTTPYYMNFARLFLNAIRRVVVSNEEISHLSHLIEKKQFVVLNPLAQMKNNETSYKIANETIKEYLKEIQTISMSKALIRQTAVPYSAALLRKPLALLAIPLSHEAYLNATVRGHRRMVKKAEKEGYSFKEFYWDDYLDDIFKINTSKETRSSGAMRGWYLKPVKPRHHSIEEQRYRKSYGVFKEGNLLAYLHIIICGDCGFFKYAIGHADHLKYGIMNYLISSTVREYIAHSNIKWLYYGLYFAGERGSPLAFKKHVGFTGYATFFDMVDDQGLLKYSMRVRARKMVGV